MKDFELIYGKTKTGTVLLLLLSVLCLPLKGQFHGLRSFRSDSSLQKQLADNRVKSVTETLTEYKEPFFNGKLTFDTKGRTIETIDRQGAGVKRARSEYNSKGLPLKSISYDDRDSSKITHWDGFIYDAQGRLIKRLNGSFQNGKPVESVYKETKFLPGKSRFRTEKKEFYAGKHTSNVITIDSVSGVYTFSITYEFRPGDIDAKGRRQGTKKLIQSHFKDSIRWQHHIEYKVSGRLEMADKMKSYYHKLDGATKDSRELESGEIDYDEAYMLYLQKFPEEYGGFISNDFIKALLAGQVTGKKKVYGRNIYNSAGQLIESEYFRKKIRYKYNETGQLIEQSNLSEQSTDVLIYDEKGLIIKKVTTATRHGVQQHPGTSDYTYVYY